MKKKKKIFIAVLISLLLIILLTICIKIYNSNFAETEIRILFAMTITDEANNTETIYVDSAGKLYSSFSEQKIVAEIKSGTIFQEKVVGHVSKSKLNNHYDKFCQIDEDMYFYGRNEGGHEYEDYFAFYGVKYNNGEPELIDLGDSTYYADDPDAEDIVQWMKKWNYR